MKKYFIAISLLLISIFSIAQNKDKTAIRKLMAEQVAAWNSGNIDAFMQGYWKSDSLLLLVRKADHGWQTTLEVTKSVTGYHGDG